MRKWMTMVGLLVSVAGLPLTVGCDDAEAAFDCQQVCARYKDCVNSDYDVGTCRDRCRDRAKEDATWKDKADACQACIDDRSCTAATFACTTECVGIVP